MQMQNGPARDRRPDALGDFFRFPDEILCSIIARLCPRTVGTLACVSSVFYILCNEEPLWMQLCLDQHLGGFLDFEGSWRQSALSKFGYFKKGTAYKPPLCFDGFSSLFLYKRWYRCHISLEGFALDSGVVDRRENLSVEEFRATYDGKKPVLITDVTKDWPAQKSWTLRQLVDRYGDLAFRVSQSYGKKIKMKLRDYASYMARQHDEDPLYIFDAKFGELAPAMLEDFSVPSIFSEDLLAVLDKEVRPPYRWLVAGPARSGASWHVDPALTSAWNTLLAGRKRWALYPPGRVPPAVVVHVDEDDGSVNFDGPTSLQWWLDIYPTLLEEDMPLECTQLPGETISVPSGWWHCVLNIDDSIAVTQNYVNSTNLELVCLDMAPGFHHRGVARAGQLAVKENLQRASKGATGYQLPDADFMAAKGRDGNKSDAQLNWSATDNLNYPQNDWSILDVDHLATYIEELSNHFISSTSEGGYLERSDLREWLRRLWRLRPDLHQRIWKCACLALDAETWLGRVTCICKAHGIPIPVEEEQLPVGSGSNPVYLVDKYVIKLCVEEEGCMVAMEGLRSELQFYAVLHESDSALKTAIPTLIASGIVFPNANEYKTLAWDGWGRCPVPTEASHGGKKRQRDVIKVDKSRYRAKRSDAEIANVSIGENHEKTTTRFSAHNGSMTIGEKTSGKAEDPVLWPYLVEKRCEGTNLAQSIDKMTKEDYVALAAFLGEQSRILHSLPLPSAIARTTWTQKTTRITGKESMSVVDTANGCYNIANGSTGLNTHRVNSCGTAHSVDQSARTPYQNGAKQETKRWSCEVPPEWQYFVGLLRQQRANAMDRFLDWESLPAKLLEQLEMYLPEDPVVLVGVQEVCDGVAKMVHTPVWLHMDVMTDNIQMAPYSGDNYVPGVVDLDRLTCGRRVTHTCRLHEEMQDGITGVREPSKSCMEICSTRAMQARYILDFGDVAHGDPLYEFLALHISVFKCDPLLLSLCLKSYGLPLSLHSNSGNKTGIESTTAAAGRDFTRPSYRAMCYCLLHEHDSMRAILKQVKDFRTATSFEEIEEKLWGLLNERVPEASLKLLQ